MTSRLHVHSIGYDENNDAMTIASDGTITAIKLGFSSELVLPSFVGMVAAFAMSSAPGGWLACQGGEVLITDYQDLYAVIGTTWNTAVDPTSGNGTQHSAPASGNFRLPDFRGSFLRGVGTISGKTDQTTLAGYQAEKTKRPSTNFTGSMTGGATSGGSSSQYLLSVAPTNSGDYGQNWYGHTPRRGNSSTGVYVNWYPGAGHTHYTTITATGSITGGGDDENRPANFGVLYCIKY